mgnify:CR=1 FL=1
MFTALKNTFHNISHLFFPHLCLGCGSDAISSNESICIECLYKLPETNFENIEDNAVSKSLSGRVPFVYASAIYYFTKQSILQSIIFQLKYKHQSNLGIELGELMGKKLSQSKLYEDVDVLIPLPLHPKKMRQRGYNQAQVLCEGIQTFWNKPIINNAVIRQHNTKTQTKKDRTHRWQNMESVFIMNNEALIINKHILLIDDVITTGASIEAFYQAVQHIPNIKFSVCTLAYTSNM